MQIQTHTSPFTGCDFDAVHISGNWIVTNPLTGKPILCPISENERYIMIPTQAFDKIETLTPAETAVALDVSRQRVDQLVSTGKICQRYVNGSPMMLKTDVVKYKATRKNGRPRKE